MIFSKYLYIDSEIPYRRNILCEIFIHKRIFGIGITWERYDMPWLRYLRIYFPFVVIIITFNDIFYREVKLHHLTFNKWIGPFYSVQNAPKYVLASRLFKYGLDSKNYGFCFYMEMWDRITLIISPFFIQYLWNITQ